MFKKTMAILLSMALLLTLCPLTGVFAALPTVSPELKVDNFNTLETTDSYFSNYPNSYRSQTSDVFLQDGQGVAGYKIIEAMGADGATSKMLEMKSTATSGNSILTLDTDALTYIIPER